MEDEEEATEEGSKSWKPPEKRDGEFVIVKYDSKYYPGVVLSASSTTASISAMQSIGRLWKWPERPDVLDYPWEAVVGAIKEPTKTSKTRNVFSVPELYFLYE